MSTQFGSVPGSYSPRCGALLCSHRLILARFDFLREASYLFPNLLPNPSHLAFFGQKKRTGKQPTPFSSDHATCSLRLYFHSPSASSRRDLGASSCSSLALYFIHTILHDAFNRFSLIDLLDIMKLRAPSSRRRPSRYDDDGDFGGDGGQQVSGASNTLRRGSGRPQRTVRTLARPLGKNDFDDPYSYSGFTTGPRPMAHNHRFNPELARHCAFPSLPMDHEGPGPSEIWKAQNQVGNDTVAEPRVEHPRYNFDVFILDAMEDSNYPEHLLDDSQLGSEETTRHKQDGNIQPEASSVNQPDRPFATTGPFWNRPPPMNPSGRPLAPFEVLRQAFWKSRRQHENVMAETATAVPQLAPVSQSQP